MIALFDEPPRVSITAPEIADGSRVALLLGFTDVNGLEGLLCLEDGSIMRIPVAAFTLDYRYEVETDRWIDQNAPRPDQED